MEEMSVLEEFRQQRKMLADLRESAANPRLKAMWDFLDAKIETKRIIQEIPSVDDIVSKADAKTPLNAGRPEEIIGVGFYIMRQCSEGKQVTTIVHNSGMASRDRKPTRQTYVDDAMAYVKPALDFVEEELERLVKTPLKKKSTKAKRKSKKGTSNTPATKQADQKQVKQGEKKDGQNVSGIENGGDDSEKVLRHNLVAFLVSKKEFPRNSLDRGMAHYPYNFLTVTHPETNIPLVIFNIKAIGHARGLHETSEFMTKVHKVGSVGKYNPFLYFVSASEESNEVFVIREIEIEDEDNSNIISQEDFPTYTQLLFASPLSDKGRRTYRELYRIAKHRLGFVVHTPCQDYIDLQIKENKRTAAQIHRMKDSEENIALVLAGYQENFPDTKSPSYLFKGEAEQLSGYTNERPGEKNWLEGNLGHQQLIYKAGVYVLRPGSLVLQEIENELSDLLELAKKSAQDKGPAEREEGPKGEVAWSGTVATIRAEGIGEVDRLGRDTLVKTLSGMFVHTKCGNGFTMALLGDWGQGKSTLMGLLQTELAKKHKGKFEFANYNAWEYEKTENVSAGIAQEVVKGLVEPFQKHFWKKQRLRFRFAIKEYKADLWRLLIYSVVAVLLILVSRSFLENNALKGVGLAGGILAVLILLCRSLTTIIEHPLATKLETYLKLPTYGRHLGDVPVIRNHLRTLCELTLVDHKRLLVFVDDLDRCNVYHIAKVLDAVRLVMAIPNVIVMIGIDHRIAFSAIRKHYRELADEGDARGPAEIARDYLGKIIQLPLRLRAASRDELRQYVFEGVFDEKNLVDDSKHAEESESKGDVEGPLEVSVFDTPTLSDATTLQPKTDTATKSDGTGREVTEEEISEAIKDTKSERDEFYKLSGKFNFSNPRQLLRLHNSFRFLKGYGRGVGKRYNTLDMLKMLFWQEFLHNWPMDVRGRCMAALIDGAQIERLEPEVGRVLKTIRSDIKKLFNERKDYAELADFIRIVVLPHSEEGVLDTQEEIDRWIQRKTLEAAKKQGEQKS